jgi:hypothetical protein
VSSTELGKALRSVQTEQLTHPVPVLRAKEIDRWAKTNEYSYLLKNPSLGYDDKADKKGDWRNW